MVEKYPSDRPAKECTSRWLCSQREYKLIEQFYGTQRARRSNVPYINHIIEGCELLWTLTNVVADAREGQVAFCLHPIMQNPVSFEWMRRVIEVCSHRILWLTHEYALAANSYLPKDLGTNRQPVVPDNTVLRLMLMADKVQNRKDLERYNRDHPHFDDLQLYFERWFEELKIPQAMYVYLAEHVW